MEHFTVTVEVKQVIPPKPILNGNGYPVKAGLGGGDLVSERQVIDRLRVVVSAGNEEEAVQRAINMLNASAPPAEQHLHRASCDDSGGNLVCGFPAGPTIASGS